MPTPNYSPDDALLRTINDLKNRVHALESQTNYAVRDGSGNVRVASGLLPSTDYGIQITDGNGNSQELIPVQKATITTSESTSSGPFADLATVGPSVNIWIGQSQQALIMASALITLPGAGGTGVVGVQIDGAVPYTIAYLGAAASGVAGSQAGAFDIVLTPGAHTLTLKYSATGGSVAFSNRSLMVWPG